MQSIIKANKITRWEVCMMYMGKRFENLKEKVKAKIQAEKEVYLVMACSVGLGIVLPALFTLLYNFGLTR